MTNLPKFSFPRSTLSLPPLGVVACMRACVACLRCVCGLLGRGEGEYFFGGVCALVNLSYVSMSIACRIPCDNLCTVKVAVVHACGSVLVSVVCSVCILCVYCVNSLYALCM